ncbi:hypothetical protein NKG94_05735 [Micromonospora sp. M12]
MIVDVRTTSTGWDSSLKQLGEAFHERLQERADQPAQDAPPPAGITVRIAALGLTDAYADTGAGLTGDVLPVWLHGATALVGPRWTEPTAPGTRPGPCPLCVQRRWQAIRLREERHALEHDASVGVVAALPHLTPFAVDALWQLVRQACRTDVDRPVSPGCTTCGWTPWRRHWWRCWPTRSARPARPRSRTPPRLPCSCRPDDRSPTRRRTGCGRPTSWTCRSRRWPTRRRHAGRRRCGRTTPPPPRR